MTSSYLSDQCILWGQHSRPLARGCQLISSISHSKFLSWDTKSFPWDCVIICSSTLVPTVNLTRIRSWFTLHHHCNFLPFYQRPSFMSFIIDNAFLYEALEPLLTSTIIMHYSDSSSSWGWVNVLRKKVSSTFFEMPRGAYEWIVPFLPSISPQKTILYSTNTPCLPFWSFLRYPTIAILKRDLSCDLHKEKKSLTKNFKSIQLKKILYFNLWYLKVRLLKIFKSILQDCSTLPPFPPHTWWRKGTI